MSMVFAFESKLLFVLFDEKFVRAKVVFWSAFLLFLAKKQMPIGDKTQPRQSPPRRHKNSNATYGKKSRLNSYSTMGLIFCSWYSIKCVLGNIGVVVGTSKERETWVTQVMGEH
jgi:hypothetical protein